MFENIIKILDKSKNAKVDILVARDMVIAEENIPYKEMNKASDLIGRYYETIVKCYKTNDFDTIKKLAESNSRDEREAIAKEVAERIENNG